MSNSPLVSYTKLSPCRTTPRNHKIDTVTIHCMAAPLSVENCGDGFADPDRQASSNYGIGPDGRIALYVDEGNRSWCSSSPPNDHRAVTIEVACEKTHPYAVTAAAYKAMLDLLVDICKRNGIPKLVWSTNKSDRVNHRNGCNMTVHRDYAAKACPGDYLYQRHGAIAEAVNKRLEEEEDMNIEKLINEMTPEQAYRLQQKAASHAATLPEPEWSKEEGAWDKATQAGLVNGANPEGYIKRCEVAAVLGRNGMI